MAQEINLGGTIYISSKHAAEKTGYTQDYIGQLARGGSIEAKRVSGMWYILEESLRGYKEKADQFVPVPPQGFTASHDAEVAVAFDGKDYISANRAAKLTGYNQDYVGQLARSGTILSRQVGNRWYVDRESLLAHKKEKDDLLAAVQVESVGLAKPGAASVAPIEEEIVEEQAVESKEDTHFSYHKEEVPLVPEFEVDEVPPMPEFPTTVAKPQFEEYREGESEVETAYVAQKIDESPEEMEPEAVQEVAIPIRVVAPQAVEEEMYVDEEAVVVIRENPRPVAKKPRKAPTLNVFAISTLTVVAALGTIAYMGASLGLLNFGGSQSPVISQNAAVATSMIESGSAKAHAAARTLFSKEIVYTRK